MRLRHITPLLIAAGLILHSELPRAQQPPPPKPPAQPQKPDPATSPGEKTPAPPDAQPKPQVPSPVTPPAGGAPPRMANAYASTYQALASRTTVIRNATILTAAGPLIERGSILLQNGKVAAVGQSVNAPGGRRGHRRRRQVGHARHHRHPFASRRLLGARHRIAAGRQRDDQSGDRGSVGRPFDLAAGSAVRARACRRRDVDADPARIRESDRRSRRHGEERAVAHGGGDEVSRRAGRAEDGVRRESAARLRAAQPGAVDANGEHRRVPPHVAVRR